MTFTQIILGVIAILGTACTYFALPLCRTYMSAKQIERIISWAEIAIRFYETHIAGSGLGDKKKEKVLAFLREKGFDLSDAEMNMIIDSIVAQLNSTEWNKR